MMMQHRLSSKINWISAYPLASPFQGLCDGWGSFIWCNLLPGSPIRINGGIQSGSQSVGNQIGSSAASAIANAATRSALDGSQFGDNIRAAIPDVIAQAIGAAVFTKCFVAGTLIHTKLGVRPIEEIRAGDKVYSRHDSFGSERVKLSSVVQTFRTEDQETMLLRVMSVDGIIEDIRTTPGHPFAREINPPNSDQALDDVIISQTTWVWAPAKSLQVGDYLTDTHGQRLKVEAVIRDGEIKTVYNFEVAGDHTYFVGEFGTWVHNQSSNEPKNEPKEENILGVIMDALNPKNLLRAQVKQDLLVAEILTGDDTFGEAEELILDPEYIFEKYENGDVGLHLLDSSINKTSAMAMGLTAPLADGILGVESGLTYEMLHDSTLDGMRDLTLPEGYVIIPELSGGTDAAAIVLDPLVVVGKIKLFGKIIGNGLKGRKAEVITRKGVITNPGNVKVSANEKLAADTFSDLGYDVQYLKPVENQRTADLYVSGIGTVDEFTPKSFNPSSIARGVEKKVSVNSQQAGNVFINVPSDMSTVDIYSSAVRTFGKPAVPNSTHLFFRRNNDVFTFDRSVINNLRN